MRRDGISVAVTVAIAALVGLATPGVDEAAQRRASAEPFPCDVRTTARVVAIGDIHGAHDRFVAILRSAGLIDTRNRWSGGHAVLVQTGDVVDRGPDSRKSLDLLRKLERDAQRAGGRVVALLGNHEWMRVTADWRYVSEGELKAFSSPAAAARRDRALETSAPDAALPLGALEMQAAFDRDGEYGAWVRARPAVARVNGVLFLHGGLSAEVAPLGCEGINQKIRDELAELPATADRVGAMLASSETGPLWYRGLVREPESVLAPALDTMLRDLRARAIVVGHSATAGRIAMRLGGRVVLIDTGMLDGTFFPGGAPSALEIAGDSVTAIYLDRREALSALPAAPTPAPAATVP